MPRKRRPIDSYLELSITRSEYFKATKVEPKSFIKTEASDAENLDIQQLIRGNYEEWKQYGNCKDSDLDIFFSDDMHDVKIAKSICENCPVKDPCLAYAIRNRARGIWGGTSERQRRNMSYF